MDKIENMIVFSKKSSQRMDFKIPRLESSAKKSNLTSALKFLFIRLQNAPKTSMY